MKKRKDKEEKEEKEERVEEEEVNPEGVEEVEEVEDVEEKKVENNNKILKKKNLYNLNKYLVLIFDIKTQTIKQKIIY